jgi:hypothetical protein
VATVGEDTGILSFQGRHHFLLDEIVIDGLKFLRFGKYFIKYIVFSHFALKALNVGIFGVQKTTLVLRTPDGRVLLIFTVYELQCNLSALHN